MGGNGSQVSSSPLYLGIACSPLQELAQSSLWVQLRLFGKTWKFPSPSCLLLLPSLLKVLFLCSPIMPCTRISPTVCSWTHKLHHVVRSQELACRQILDLVQAEFLPLNFTSLCIFPRDERDGGFIMHFIMEDGILMATPYSG